MFKNDKIWKKIEYILALAAIASLFLYIYIYMTIEIHDMDIWLHLKTGEYILQHNTVPHSDIFSYTIYGKQWLDHSWLVQIILYLISVSWGTDGLLYFAAAVVITSFLILLFSTFRENKHFVPTLVILYLSIFASRLRFNIRPENLSLLLFCLYLFALTKGIRKKWLLFFLPLVQLIWVNCHGFFILGPLLIGIFIIAEGLKKTKALPFAWAEAEPLDNASYKRLIITFFLACLVSFINPYGYKGALYPLWVIQNSAGTTSIFYQHITELLSPWELFQKTGFNVTYYYILVAVSFCSFFLRFKKINIAHLLLWSVFLFLASKANRNMIFFDCVAFLACVNNINLWLDDNQSGYLNKLPAKVSSVFKYLIIGAVIIYTLRQDYLFLSGAYYDFQQNRVKSIMLGVTQKLYPEKAVDFILENNLPGNIFNFFNQGSYLIYRLWPERKVFIDGRTELYGDELFKTTLKIKNADKNTIDDVFKKYDINTILLRGENKDIGTLSRYLLDTDKWAIVYLDGDSIIFLKDSPNNKPFIDKLKIKFHDWKVYESGLKGAAEMGILPEPNIKRAEILYSLGFYDQAINEAKEALRINYKTADAYNVLGDIYLKRLLYKEALQNLRLAHKYKPTGLSVLPSLMNLYFATGKFRQAIATGKELLRIYPFHAEGYYLLAKNHIALNEVNLAIDALNKAIRINPFDEVYYKQLGELLSKNKDTIQAIAVYKKAINAGINLQEFKQLIESAKAKNSP